jgi:hypothetical protein
MPLGARERRFAKRRQKGTNPNLLIDMRNGQERMVFVRLTSVLNTSSSMSTSTSSASGPDPAEALLAGLKAEPSEALTSETVRSVCQLARKCHVAGQQDTAFALYDAAFVRRDPGALVCADLEYCGAVLRAEAAAFDPQDLEAAARYFSQQSKGFAASMGTGTVRIYQLRFEEAETEFREASRLVDAADDCADRSVLALAALCRSLCLQGQFSKAAEVFAKELLPKATAAFGPASLTVVRCRAGLGRCLMADSRPDAAERELSAAQLTYRRLLGPRDPEMMRASSSLANSLADQAAGVEAAGRLLRELLALQERELGRLHPDVLCTRRLQLDIPQRRYTAGLVATAAELYADHVKVFGREHVYTGLAVLHEARARYHVGQQELPVALPLAQQATALLSRTAGELQFRALLARATLCDILAGLHRFQEASAAYQGLAVLLRRAHRSPHPLTANALQNAAGALRRCDPGDGSTAPVVERLYREALQELQALSVSDRSHTSNLLLCYRNLFLAIFRQPNRVDEAAAVLRESIALHEKALGPEHEDTLWCVLHLAAAMIPPSRSPMGGLARQQRYEAIVALLQPALPVIQRTLRPGHPSLDMCCHTLAGCYLELGRTEEANRMEALLTPPKRSRWRTAFSTPLVRTTGLVLAVGLVAAAVLYGVRAYGFRVAIACVQLSWCVRVGYLSFPSSSPGLSRAARGQPIARLDRNILARSATRVKDCLTDRVLPTVCDAGGASSFSSSDERCSSKIIH